VKCWEEIHLKYALGMSLPLIFLWFVIFPGLLFRYLYRNRSHFNEYNVKLRFSFLYRGYKEKVLFWEFVVMVRKYALVIVTLLGRLHSVNL